MSLIEKTFSNGEVIIKEGDTGTSFFQIIEGSALVYGGFGKNDQVKLSSIDTGEFFGEMSTLEGYPRSATIVAKGAVRVVEIPGEDMDAFFEDDPRRIAELTKHLLQRLQITSNDLNEAKALLSELREADANKKSNSLFAKIKKHIDMYQSNKNKVTEADTDPLRDIFAGLINDETSQLRQYESGKIIYDDFEFGDCMFILHSGKVGIYKGYGTDDSTEIAEITPVAYFGESGFYATDLRGTTAVTKEDTIVELIYQEELASIFKFCPQKIRAFLRLLSYNLRKLDVDFLNTCKEITEAYNKK